MTENPLNPRQKQVLTAIVDHYIVKAEPVSSSLLSKSPVLRTSSATIRHTMAQLEERGLVEQPHSSAGRLPTDLGYRVYVDELMHPETLHPEDQRVLDEALGRESGEEARMAYAAKILAELTLLMGMVAPPPAQSRGWFRNISLVPLEEGKVVLVLTSSESEVRSLMMDSGMETSIFRLEAVAKRLNQQLRGKPISDLDRLMSSPAERSVSKDESLAWELLNRSILKLTGTKSGDEVFLFGAKNLLHHQEFDKFSDVGSILELLDSKIALAHFLRQKADDEGVHVTVGEEREDGVRFRSLSLITTSFTLRGGRGTIGVLGPKRIPYARLIPLVDYAARALSRNRAPEPESDAR